MAHPYQRKREVHLPVLALNLFKFWLEHGIVLTTCEQRRAEIKTRLHHFITGNGQTDQLKNILLIMKTFAGDRLSSYKRFSGKADLSELPSPEKGSSQHKLR